MMSKQLRNKRSIKIPVVSLSKDVEFEGVTKRRVNAKKFDIAGMRKNSSDSNVPTKRSDLDANNFRRKVGTIDLDHGERTDTPPTVIKETCTRDIGKNNKRTDVFHCTKRHMYVVPEAQRFWVRNGPVIGSLVELRDALYVMPDHQYQFHVTPVKNDFADWVEQVLGDRACAELLRHATSRRVAVEQIEELLASSYCLQHEK